MCACVHVWACACGWVFVRFLVFERVPVWGSNISDQVFDWTKIFLLEVSSFSNQINFKVIWICFGDKSNQSFNCFDVFIEIHASVFRAISQSLHQFSNCIIKLYRPINDGCLQHDGLFYQMNINCFLNVSSMRSTIYFFNSPLDSIYGLVLIISCLVLS